MAQRLKRWPTSRWRELKKVARAQHWWLQIYYVCVKDASRLVYFMLKQLVHFLQNILADLLYKLNTD